LLGHDTCKIRRLAGFAFSSIPAGCNNTAMVKILGYFESLTLKTFVLD
jgi:hypothetical protein